MLLPAVLGVHGKHATPTQRAKVLADDPQSVAATFMGIVRAMKELADEIKAANVKVSPMCSISDHSARG